MAVDVAEREAPPSVPRALVTSGVFKDVGGLLKVLKALQGAMSTEDIVGFAIPLPGDPADPETVSRLVTARRSRFNPLTFLLDVLDPHRPPPEYSSLARGQNSLLARPILGDLWRWLVGVKTFRIPDPQQDAGGVWVLAHPNQAAAIAGMEGAAAGGAFGALSALAIPREQQEMCFRRLMDGECVLTACETDPGRAARDARLLRKHGASDVLQVPIFGAPRQQP